MSSSPDPLAPPLFAPPSYPPSCVPSTSVVRKKGRIAVREVSLTSPQRGYWIAGALVGVVAILVLYIELRLRYI